MPSSRIPTGYTPEQLQQEMELRAEQLQRRSLGGAAEFGRFHLGTWVSGDEVQEQLGIRVYDPEELPTQEGEENMPTTTNTRNTRNTAGYTGPRLDTTTGLAYDIRGVDCLDPDRGDMGCACVSCGDARVRAGYPRPPRQVPPGNPTQYGTQIRQQIRVRELQESEGFSLVAYTPGIPAVATSTPPQDTETWSTREARRGVDTWGSLGSRLPPRRRRVWEKLSTYYKYVYWRLQEGDVLPDVTRRDFRVQMQEIRARLRNQQGQDMLAAQWDYASKHLRRKSGWRYVEKLREIRRNQLTQLRRGKSVPSTQADLGRWVSVELECILPDQAARDAVDLALVRSSWAQFYTSKDDGSLRAYSSDEDSSEETSHEVCVEYVVSHPRGDYAALNFLCDLLVDHDVRVNKTCGLHVHLDMRHLPVGGRAEVSRVARKLGKYVPALREMLPASRRENTYCRQDVNSFRGDNRYSFVNVQAYLRHTTLEIRGHSGTASATKIRNWVELLQILVESDAPRRKLGSMSDLVYHLAETGSRISQDLLEYIWSRAKLFRVDPAAVRPAGDDVARDSEVA